MAHEEKRSQPCPVGDTAPEQETSVVISVPEATEVPAAEKKQASPGKKDVKKKRKKKKGSRNVTIIFYTVYFVMVAAIVAGLLYANSLLAGWLADYEASRPDIRCEEVFQEHFADPDWEDLYTRAGLSDTAFEGSAAFVAYMDARVDGGELSYVETSAGLSGSRRYLLKLGTETLGYFSLTDHAPEGAKISDWQLDQLVLGYSYSESITVQKQDDLTVYVNGVPLTDDYTIRIGATLSEDYLPEGLHGPRTHIQYLDGLMVEPVITAADADGNPVEVTYDAQRDLYTVLPVSHTIGQKEYDLVLSAAKSYAMRMIGKASNHELGRYFDTSSDSYKALTTGELWIQPTFYRGYQLGEAAVTGYFPHSQTLFSVHVELPVMVTCTDGTIREYRVDHSFFFQKQNNTWKCTTLTGTDIRQQSDYVRLTFCIGDSVIFTNMYNEDIATLELPTVTAPKGQVFAGWFRQVTNDDGSTEYALVFGPDTGSVVPLSAGTNLEPMTLFAMFEHTADNGGNE